MVARASSGCPGSTDAENGVARLPDPLHERIIAWTATQNGHRIRLRYTGTEKNDAWLHNRCAAINLRTLLKAGLTRRDGAWALS
jgi:hypothetical protein